MTPPKSHPEANVYIPKKVQFLGIHGRKKTTLTASISTWGWAHGKHGEIESSPLALQNPWRIHGAAIYGNIYHQYTQNVSIYTIHGSYGKCNHESPAPFKREHQMTCWFGICQFLRLNRHPVTICHDGLVSVSGLVMWRFSQIGGTPKMFMISNGKSQTKMDENWGYPVAWKNRVYLGTSLRRAFSAMLMIKNQHNIFIVGRQDDEPKFTWNNLPSVSLIVSFLFLSPSCFPGRKVSL